MKIQAQIFLKPFYDCDDQPDSSVCRAVQDGILAVEKERAEAGKTSAFLSLTTVEYFPNGAIEQALEITSQPTLIFFDQSGNLALARLSRGQITKGRVAEVYRFLADLQPTGNGSGQYVTPDGETVSQREIWDQHKGTWFGMGVGLALGGCPKWMPKMICDFPVWILIVVILLLALFTFKTLK